MVKPHTGIITYLSMSVLPVAKSRKPNAGVIIKDVKIMPQKKPCFVYFFWCDGKMQEARGKWQKARRKRQEANGKRYIQGKYTVPSVRCSGV